MKFNNIIWFLVDSVRSYHTNADERGRLVVMDELAEDAVDFKVAITSAPSTVMSVSSMMTGVGTMYQSRDYNGFKYNKSQFISLPQVLKNNGYTIYSLIFFPEGRRFLKPILSNICENNWVGKYDENEFWSNDQMNEILEDVMSVKLKEPFFFYTHYNCRHDPYTSEKVKIGMSRFKDAGYYSNSIVILNSDHGYPDASRNISFYDKRKYGHDLIMTDDNILTPQIIKFPRIEAKQITTPISTLDIAPTVLDYLNLLDSFDLTNFSISGKSRLPWIKAKEGCKTDIVRVDNRFIFQNNKVVALRNDKYKYIYYYTNGDQEFFDLTNDPEEEVNLIDSIEYKFEINKFKEKLAKQENEIIKFHVIALNTKISNYTLKSNVIIIGSTNKEFELVFDQIYSGLGYKKTNGAYEVKIDEILNKLNSNISILFYHNKTRENGNTVFFFPIFDDPIVNYEIKKCYKRLKSSYFQYKYVVNGNLDIINLPEHWFIFLYKKLLKRIPMIWSEPKTLFIDILVWSKKIIFKFKY